MSDHFFAYYEHLAKLSQIANKQTMFLAHLLYRMEWDSDAAVNIVDLSSRAKKEIMRKIAPDTDEKNLSVYADQYLGKLKKAGFVKNVDRGVWIISPSCFGQYKHAKKRYREEKEKIFMTLEYNQGGLSNFTNGER